MKNSNTPKLVYENLQAITRTKENVDRTLPSIQAVFDAYNKVAETADLPELNNESFTDLFNDVEGFINAAKIYYYNTTFAKGHEALGIGFEKGYELVSDKMPDLSEILNTCKAYYSTLATNVHGHAGNHLFMISNGKVIINKEAINRAIESERLYLSTPNELAFFEAATNFADSFKKMNDALTALSPGLAMIDNSIGHRPVVDFVKMRNLFTQINGQVYTDDFTVSTEVLRKIKAAN